MMRCMFTGYQFTICIQTVLHGARMLALYLLNRMYELYCVLQVLLNSKYRMYALY